MATKNNQNPPKAPEVTPEGSVPPVLDGSDPPVVEESADRAGPPYPDVMLITPQMAAGVFKLG